ncbi:UPF0118 membrane protein [Lentibacillus sp. JNUCC-1]|uniref:sporulation integral membrane protein YtvI n=1 Tax=Lentibacillus sp. JNUCC-1 TaxID=2654513 RepID=UPI0012E8B05E|nr:sporulation integral membrane protein YtvI [Lentibacillus sp. JNUCC-1]MUV36247.1 UPF0118 membrane protein [Lentibacillus sp. JNUCC-1]
MFRFLTKRQWTIILLLVVTVLTLYFILPISVPLVLAFITALILNPVIRMLQKALKASRKMAVLIVFLLFVLVLGLLGTFFVTKAISQVVTFVEEVPAYFNELTVVYDEWEARFESYAQNLPSEFVQQVSTSFEENVTSLSQTAKEKITIDSIAQVFTSIPNYLIAFLVYLIALFLFMLELPILKAKAYNLMTDATKEKVSFMSNRLATVILGFLKAQFFVSIFIFLISLIGLLFIAPKVAFLMSLIIWAVDMIPIIGSIIILGPWAIFMFLSGDIEMGVQLSILTIILLGVRRTVEPKVMGQQIGLSPLATLIAMFLGLKLIGLFGFILGPLLVIAFTSAREAGIIKWNIKI